MFGHEKFGAYKYAIEFAALASDIIEKVPPGYGKLIDQLRRAAISVPLNIAEGSGKTTESHKRQHYAIARGEAMECAAIVDVLLCLRMIECSTAQCAKELLKKVAAILSSVCRKKSRAKDSDHGQGQGWG